MLADTATFGRANGRGDKLKLASAGVFDSDASASWKVDMALGSGDFLVLAFAYIQRMSDRGIDLPFKIPQTITYEHHFPRAWYVLDDNHNEDDPDGGAIRVARRPPRCCGSKAIVEAFTQRSVSARAAAAARRRQDAEDAAAAGVMHGFNATPTLSHTGQADHSILPKGIICGQLVQRDYITGEVSVQCLDESGLRDATVTAPEQCVLSKYLLPEMNTDGHDDFIFVTFTPKLFSIERRFSRHKEVDVKVPLEVRGDLWSAHNSYEATAPPVLVDSARYALQKLAWFIEATDGRAVIEMRATLKFRKGLIWFLWADRLVLSPRPPLDQTPHFGRIKVHRLAGLESNPGSMPPSPSAAAQRHSAVGVPHDDGALDDDRLGASVAFASGSFDVNDSLESPGGSKEAPRLRATRQPRRLPARPYGAWPSFCKLKVPDAEVIAAAERKFIEATTRGQSARTTIRKPPLLTVSQEPASAGDAAQRMAALADANPLALMEPLELDQFWCAFDEAVTDAVDRERAGHTLTTRAATAPPGINAPPPGPEAAGKASPTNVVAASPGDRRSSPPQPLSPLSASAAEAPDRKLSTSSAGSILSTLLVRSSVAHRPANTPSLIRRKVHLERLLASDNDTHIRTLVEDFGVTPSAAWGYMSRLEAGAAMAPTAGPSGTVGAGSAFFSSSSLSTSHAGSPRRVSEQSPRSHRSGSSVATPACSRTATARVPLRQLWVAALDEAIGDAYQSSLAQPRDPTTDLLLGKKKQDQRGQSIAQQSSSNDVPWGRLTLPRGSWVAAFPDVGRLASRRCEIDSSDPKTLVCHVIDPTDAVRTLVALKAALPSAT
jgi:hypothetical protein